VLPGLRSRAVEADRHHLLTPVEVGHGAGKQVNGVVHERRLDLKREEENNNEYKKIIYNGIKLKKGEGR
jgi:hypothetical protein